MANSNHPKNLRLPSNYLSTQKMNYLLTLVFTTLLFTGSFTAQSNASNNPPETELCKKARAHNGIQCKMSVEDVLRKQSFDIDDPISEQAAGITEVLIKEFNLIYYIRKEDKNGNVQSHVASINRSISAAKDLGMDVSMFKEDLIYANALK